MSDQMPYSYHTFMYPFYWRDGRKFQIDESRWTPAPFQKTVKNISEADILTYNTFQYFSPKARRLIFDDDNSVIDSYRFDGIESGSSFLDFELDEPVPYRLRVHQIRLELMEALNIGVLILETENYGERTDPKWEKSVDVLGWCSQKQRLHEITKINDMGRRVFSPYLIWNEKDNRVHKGGEAPRKITLRLPEKKEVPLVDCTEIGKGELKIEQASDGFAGLILGPEHTDFELLPAIDDRMFVACCLGVQNFEAFQSAAAGEYVYQRDRKSAEDLYKLIFLERGDPTCQNQEMLQEKLRDHMYGRWIQYGTVHGITEYSLVCITGCDSDGRLSAGLRPAVINPFLTEYVEMAKIAVLQRAAMIQLEDEASGISQGGDEADEAMRQLENAADGNDQRENESDEDRDKRIQEYIKTIQEHINSIQGLWKKYLLFQSELLLSEVTFQEQGAEVYDILKQSFRISELSTSLNTNMYNLHEMSEFADAALRREHDRQDSESDNQLGTAVNLFSVMGISIALAGLVQDAVGLWGIEPEETRLRGIVLSMVTLGVELFILYIVNKIWLQRIHRNRRNDYFRTNRNIWIWTIPIVVIAIIIQTLLLWKL